MVLTKKKSGNLRRSKRSSISKGISLYADYHPKTSVKGFGYKDATKAKDTLIKLKKMKVDRTYWFQVVNTMYNRAKYHKNQTHKMKEAMKVYEVAIRKKKASHK